MKKGFRIVVTGGPGGGKTTAADLFRRELGERIVIVPEAATILYGGGFPRSEDHDVKRSIQKAIYGVQTCLEEVRAIQFEDRILLCDRGTIDGAAYWPGPENGFFEALQTTEAEELGRYDAVLFFETAAVGKMSIEGGNPIRTESLEEAIILNQKLKLLWEKHPFFIFIPHQQSFLKKINMALEHLSQIVHRLEER